MRYLEIARGALESPEKPSETPASAGRAGSARHPKAEDIALMGLEEFAQAGLVVRVRSSILGQDVLFVSDNVPEAAIAHRGLTVYRARELRKLAILGPSPRSLKTIHDAKTIFDGVITDV